MAAAAAAVAAAAAGDRGSGTESSITAPSKSKSGNLREQLKLPLRLVRGWWREWCLAHICRKDPPPPVAFPDESNQDELQEEDRRRLIQLFITNERIEYTEDKKVRVMEDQFVTIAVAYFDFNFDDKEGPGVPPFILVNRKLLPRVNLDGLYEEYDDPENPPISLTNPDGTTMMLLGEFRAKWSPQGPIKEYIGQQIFLNPNSFEETRCVVLPEASPHEVLIGLGTIKQLKLNEHRPTIAAIDGQGGKREPRPRVNRDAVNEKARQLSADKEAQLREQRKIEKMMEKEKEKARARSMRGSRK